MITLNATQQPGSIHQLKLLPKMAVSNFFSYNILKSKVLSFVNINASVFPNWIDVYFTRDTGAYFLKTTANDKGTFYTATIECFIPANNDELIAVMQLFKGVQFVALINTFNGDVLVGNKLMGLNLYADFATPKVVQNTAGYSLKLMGDFNNPPPLYEPQF